MKFMKDNGNKDLKRVKANIQYKIKFIKENLITIILKLFDFFI